MFTKWLNMLLHYLQIGVGEIVVKEVMIPKIQVVDS